MSINHTERDISNRKRAINLNLAHSYSEVPPDEYYTSRDEKPWQRVPSYSIILLLGVYLLLGYLTQLVEDDMPRVIKDADINRDTTDVFSEESAWRYLYEIMGDKPRVSGTVYHLDKTKDMKALVDTIAMGANQNVRTDWQLVTGDYWLNSSYPFVNYYQNASNVFAILEGESGFHINGSTSTSLLVNCHYDSVPYALGASDNVVFCAAMAETLSKFSKRTRKFKNNIIFLFNGAEENPLQGSHAFLHHPWSHGVTSVVNLDAAGMNGKATIFQVTDPRVLNAYKRTVPKPNAQSLGEFLFSSGLVPSDTDFRIWRDFGQFYGIDIAFAKWGHVYHTRYDHPDLLKAGVLQWSGNMLMTLLTELGDMDELKDTATPQAAVYYDYLNVFLIRYSLRISYAVDIVIALFAITSVSYYIWLVGPRQSTVKELMYAVLGRLACMIAGVMVTAFCVLIMVATTVQLRYLTQPWLVVPLYWMPYLITAVAVSHVCDAWKAKKSGLNRSIRTLQSMAATRLIISVALMILICIPSLISTRYLFSAPLFIMSAMSLVSLTAVRCVRLEAWQHLILEVLLSLPSTMFVYTLALRLDAMILPIMGRSPTNTPDYTIGIINIGLVTIVASTVSGIELLFSRRRLWVALSTVGALCLVLMFIPFSPYLDEGPSTQRHYWFHSEIVSYDTSYQPIERTSGIFVSKLDAYSTQHVMKALSSASINLNSRADFNEDCERYVFCNLPVYRTSFSRQLSNGLFLYTGAPTRFEPSASTTLSSRSCQGELCTYSFVMIGAAHNILTLWPRNNVTLVSWSFESPVVPSSRLLERPIYAIFHSTATYSEVFEPLLFNVTFSVPISLQSQPVLDLSHHSHKVQHTEDYTLEYKRILEAMPAYFNIASFMSFRNNYIF